MTTMTLDLDALLQDIQVTYGGEPWTAPPGRWTPDGEYTNAPAAEPEPEPAPSLIDAALARRAARPTRPPIDYDRMKVEFPKQKRALNKAIKSGDSEQVIATCRDTVKVWDEIGCWPDAWSTWQRALSDAVGWRNHIELEDLRDL